MFNSGATSRLRHAVVLDEAHRLASLELIERLMKESRKYGTMCILSSQRVDDFRSGVLESAGSYLCLRVNQPDAKRLAQYLSPDESGRRELQGALMTLTRYHALFQTEDPDAPAGKPKRVVLGGKAEK
jgi:DNA helicase HerA-like ATPase